MIKKIIRFSVMGMLISSFIYLISLLMGGNQIQVSSTNIYSILIIGFLIGNMSIIFDTDFITNFISQVLIHFIVSFFIVLGVNYVFLGDKILNYFMLFIINYIVIYVISWLIVRATISHDVDRVNQRLKEIKKDS